MFTYPHIERGYEVEFAPTEDTPDSNWTLGKVTRTKNGAVDIRLHVPLAGTEFKNDVRHIGDPRLRQFPVRNDSGVFRLAKSQLQINEVLVCQQTLMRRMDALEQTFRAVMDTMRSASVETSPATIPARRGRTAAAGV